MVTAWPVAAMNSAVAATLVCAEVVAIRAAGGLGSAVVTESPVAAGDWRFDSTTDLAHSQIAECRGFSALWLVFGQNEVAPVV
jgi:hypothetical protein